MYRGDEMILIGRYPDDGLATTARLCGLCPVGADDIRHARAAVDNYAAWYAPTVLGGPLDQWPRSPRLGNWMRGWNSTRTA